MIRERVVDKKSGLVFVRDDRGWRVDLLESSGPVRPPGMVRVRLDRRPRLRTRFRRWLRRWGAVE